jgi:hypothetical protein
LSRAREDDTTDAKKILDVLAEQLRADLAVTPKSAKQWAKRERRNGEHLLEARNRFRSDKAFGAWLAREKIRIDDIAGFGISKYIARLRQTRVR